MTALRSRPSPPRWALSSPGARSSTRIASWSVTVAAGGWTSVSRGLSSEAACSSGWLARGYGSRSLDPAPLRNADQTDRRAPVQPRLPKHSRQRADAHRRRRRARDGDLRGGAGSPADAAAGGPGGGWGRRRSRDRPRASAHAERLHPKHASIASSITTLADAVQDTERLFVHRGDRASLLGSLAYLGFDVISSTPPSSPSTPARFPVSPSSSSRTSSARWADRFLCRPASERSAAWWGCSSSTGSATTPQWPPSCSTRRSDSSCHWPAVRLPTRSFAVGSGRCGPVRTIARVSTKYRSVRCSAAMLAESGVLNRDLRRATAHADHGLRSARTPERGGLSRCRLQGSCRGRAQRHRREPRAPNAGCSSTVGHLCVIGRLVCAPRPRRSPEPHEARFGSSSRSTGPGLPTW